MNWSQILGELIDNSIGARADRIRIDFGERDALTFEDNGVGCPDLSRMTILAKHVEHGLPSDRISRYGIGAKDAMLVAARAAEIHSCHGGVLRSLSLDWDEIISRPTWQFDDPTETPVGDHQPTYTKIVLRRLHKSKPNADTLVSLGLSYSPAIANGLRIEYRLASARAFQKVEAAERPQLDHARDCAGDVGPGRHLRVTMGIITRADQRSMQGVHLFMENLRLVRANTRLGLPPHPTAGLYGLVVMSGRGWSYAKNKDEVSETDRRHIADFIRGHFADLIALAERQSEHIALHGINGLLSALTPRLKKAPRKQKRNPISNHPGDHGRKGTGRRIRRAAQHQSGIGLLVDQPESGGGIQFSVQDFAPDDPLFRVEAESIIVANRCHPAYRALCPDGLPEPILLAALVHYSSVAVANEWKDQLPLRSDELEAAWTEQLTTVCSRYVAAYAETLAASTVSQAS